jgi:hypothetical protein
MSRQCLTPREIFALVKAGAYNLPPRNDTPGFITDTGRETRPPKRFGQETQKALRGSGASQRSGYDGTDMSYGGPKTSEY